MVEYVSRGSRSSQPLSYEQRYHNAGQVRAKPARFSSGPVAIFAWCLYDWAYSAFNTVVATFVIATYFVRAVAVDPATGTAQWATCQAIAGLLIALLATPLGSIADRSGGRRLILGSFTAVMVVATGLLWFVRPNPQDAVLALVLVGTATVAFEIATVVYNAMLPEIAPPGRLGLISGLAWGSGYVGGLIGLAVCLLVLINPDPSWFGLDRGRAQHIRATAVFAATWIALFGWPVLLVVKDPKARTTPIRAVREGLVELGRSLRLAWAQPNILRYLVAHMLYADGMTTLFAFGGIFAAGTFGMDNSQVLELGIGLNVTAGVGALTCAFLEDRIGAKATIVLALSGLTILGACVLLVRSAELFWVCALGLGLFVGPAQSASRSLMAQLSPTETRNAWFGLYAFSGRATGFIGPAVLGAVTAATGSQRAGMAIILALLVTGGLGLMKVRAIPAD
jgi:MFS transporter, UMF1 family